MRGSLGTLSDSLRNHTLPRQLLQVAVEHRASLKLMVLITPPIRRHALQGKDASKQRFSSSVSNDSLTDCRKRTVFLSLATERALALESVDRTPALRELHFELRNSKIDCHWPGTGL
ncbi:hypothetical protein [Mesorhizobium sp. M1406]|uniref:hypothetical protein n=1 Tax=Mesorhizobium sp. M1406 TaxID=2957099 RepID=UPI00333D51C1